MNNQTINDAIAYREELQNMPHGFFPFPQRTGKKWCICFKFSSQSKAEMILINLTQKQAEKKATAFNSTLTGK